jgi:hypothetical protein
MQWIKNSNNKEDAMLTFATVGFVVSSLSVLASLMESLTIGDFQIIFKTPSESLVTVYLAAVFTSYVVRRNSKDKIESEDAKFDIQNGVASGR